MKVLVTGGCGFLGSNLAARFLELGEEVTIVDGLLRNGGEQNLDWLREKARGTQLQFHQGDIADSKFVAAVFEKEGPFDSVMHLAGQVAMTVSLQDPRRDLLTNVVGTLNILECCRQNSPNAFVAYSSTNKVYGDLKRLRYEESKTRYTVPDFPNGFDESLPLDFASPYGCSKGAADQYVRDWHRSFGLKTVVFRHSSIYGGRQYSTFDQGWIGWFCERAIEQKRNEDAGKSSKPFTISGTGKQVRDVLHADDLVALYLAASERPEAIAGQIFNIGGGMENSLSLLELFMLLRELLGMHRELTFEKLPRRQSDQDFFVADISKAEKLLGFKPEIDKRRGVASMLDWVKSR